MNLKIKIKRYKSSQVVRKMKKEYFPVFFLLSTPIKPAQYA